MDIEPVYRWLVVVALLISVCNTLWAIFTKDARAAVARIVKLKNQLVDHDKRIQAIESEMKHLPSKEEVAAINLSIAELKGTVGRIDASVASTTKTVHRIDEFLRGKP